MFFFFKQKTAYEMRISDWSSDVCSSDLLATCTSGLGEQWEMLDVAYKPYPACHFNHAFIDAAIRLHNDHGLKPDEIDSVAALIHKEEGIGRASCRERVCQYV